MIVISNIVFVHVSRLDMVVTIISEYVVCSQGSGWIPMLRNINSKVQALPSDQFDIRHPG